MKKFAIASHEKMALGIQSTLELFVGKDLDITYMAAYVEGLPDIDVQIATFFDNIHEEDQVVIFTDMFGGSVNQKITLAAKDRTNVFIVAGFNLPVMIEIIYGAEIYTDKLLRDLLENGRQAMQLVETDFSKVSGESTENGTNESKSDIPTETHVLRSAPVQDLGDATIKIPTTLRVDERLIHGQIAMVWSRELNLQGILVANDEAADNETQQMALKMAVPAGIPMLVRSLEDAATILKDPRAQHRRLLVLVRTVADALALAERVPNMSYINVGNVGKSVEGEKEILTQFVMLTPNELASLKKLVAIYPETALQNLPSDKKEMAQSFVS